MKRAAIAIAIAIGVFAVGIVVQEVFYPGATFPLHIRWHVREVITGIIALAAGAAYVAISRPVRS
jgi:hypothetical protein